ncbi:hypothetical protein D3C81_732900 [compost metagenome]
MPRLGRLQAFKQLGEAFGDFGLVVPQQRIEQLLLLVQRDRRTARAFGDIIVMPDADDILFVRADAHGFPVGAAQPVPALANRTDANRDRQPEPLLNLAAQPLAPFQRDDPLRITRSSRRKRNKQRHLVPDYRADNTGQPRLHPLLDGVVNLLLGHLETGPFLRRVLRERQHHRVPLAPLEVQHPRQLVGFDLLRIFQHQHQ